MQATVLAMVGLVALVSGCGGGARSSESASAGAARAAGICPVTLPNGSLPPPPFSSSWGSPEHSYGNGKLWTLFWPHGVIIAQDGQVNRDGSITMKVPWWRGLNGNLHIEGRRLDKTAQPIRARIPRAYGQSGFQPSSIIFPSDGCWEVTGKVADASLTFVTIVMKALRYDGFPRR